MLLIVFGAGASFDALPDYPPPDRYRERLPLANELFDLRFADALGSFRAATGIAPFLRNLRSGETLEVRLQELSAEGGDERIRELMAIRFYLQFMLSDIDAKWNTMARGVTNYRTLLGDVLQHVPADEPVVIANFNYDRLVEWALADRGIATENLGDHVRGRIKHFKLHGSVNWARKVAVPRLDQMADPGGWRPTEFLIQSAPQVQLTDERVVADTRPIQIVDNSLAVAALAIPLIDTKEFELPAEHLEVLAELLPKVTKVLVIGWKAADAAFREMLKTVRSAEGVIVSPNNPEEAKINLAECATLRLEPEKTSFTAYATERRVRGLLN